MPYNTIGDLPESIIHVLPLHAQEIYLSSFNNAYEEYKDRNKRRKHNEDLETICYKVAWSAVKRVYHKNEEGYWIKRQ
jgi:cation transport regulator